MLSWPFPFKLPFFLKLKCFLFQRKVLNDAKDVACPISMPYFVRSNGNPWMLNSQWWSAHSISFIIVMLFGFFYFHFHSQGLLSPPDDNEVSDDPENTSWSFPSKAAGSSVFLLCKTRCNWMSGQTSSFRVSLSAWAYLILNKVAVQKKPLSFVVLLMLLSSCIFFITLTVTM